MTLPASSTQHLNPDRSRQEVRREIYTQTMMLSLMLLPALLALSSASPVDITDITEQKNVSFVTSGLNGGAEMTAHRSIPTDQPLLTVAKFRRRRQVQTSPPVSGGSSNLKWVTWKKSLPNDAVSFYNEYVGRTDYVCKHKCEAGFYSPSKGPYCHYAKEKKAYAGTPFEILVNKDNFEILEWKDDSRGSVPQNSVRTCPGVDIYVGKNKYGLGKVSKDKAFYLPWKGSEYSYKHYKAMIINENIISQKIYDVKYNRDASKILHYPPEIMQKITLRNNECSSVVKTDTLTKTYQVEQRWGISFSIKAGVTTKFEAGVPYIAEGGVEVSTEVAFQYSQGNTLTESVTDTITVQITAPPNHSCAVTMRRSKNKMNIPFTARLSRTYVDGRIHTTVITGTYDSVQMGDVEAVIDRCELIENSKPCE